MSDPANAPTLRSLIASDLLAATGRRGLRAALSAALFEPGFLAVLLFRVAGHLNAHGWPRLAKLVWRFNVFQCGSYLHLTARVGHSLCLPHPTAIGIGETAKLGNRVTVYHSVSIARGLSDDRYPDIHDDVMICPGAIVIGGLVVGHHALIAAGAIVTKDVPPYAVVAGNPARVLRIRTPEEVLAEGAAQPPPPELLAS